jgi:hypothetical protein
VERCAVCVLWSGDVVLAVELVWPVEATELLWPVVSVDCVLLELGLVLAVDEVLVLDGVEDVSAYVPLVPCAVLLLDGLVEAVELVEAVVSVLEVGYVEDAVDWLFKPEVDWLL